jgi:hypothetical protein
MWNRTVGAMNTRTRANPPENVANETLPKTGMRYTFAQTKHSDMAKLTLANAHPNPEKEVMQINYMVECSPVRAEYERLDERQRTEIGIHTNSPYPLEVIASITLHSSNP